VDAEHHYNVVRLEEGRSRARAHSQADALFAAGDGEPAQPQRLLRRVTMHPRHE
jgi:hypothetical protein